MDLSRIGDGGKAIGIDRPLYFEGAVQVGQVASPTYNDGCAFKGRTHWASTGLVENDGARFAGHRTCAGDRALGTN